KKISHEGHEGTQRRIRILSHSLREPLCEDFPARDYQGMTLRSFTNLPVRSCGASVASQTIVAAPSATDRVAPSPPMSVRTQPGQTLFTAHFGRAAASWTVTPFNAVFETQ